MIQVDRVDRRWTTFQGSLSTHKSLYINAFLILVDKVDRNIK